MNKSQIWFTAALACAPVLLVGCDQSGKPNQSTSPSGDRVKLESGPIRHASLTDDQINRARRLQRTFSEVDPSSLEKWVDDFRRDVSPDNELKIWEQMATAYETFIASRNLTVDGKKDVYGILLMRSGAPEEEVLKHQELKVLTEKDAREILALYVGKPEPVTYTKQ